MIREGIEERLAESLNLAITHGEGAVLVADQVRDPEQPGAGEWRDRVFSTLYACPNCKISYEELEPRTFSFNSPYGACPACEGLGSREEFDPELILGDENLSLADGLVAPWKTDTAAQVKAHREALEAFLAANELQWDTPHAQWKLAVREKFLRGDGKQFLGLLTILEKQFATAIKPADLERLAAYRSQIVCTACGGARFGPKPRNVQFGDKAIHEIAALDGRQGASLLRRIEGGQRRSTDLRPAGCGNHQPAGIPRQSRARTI